uniref:Uncharacterized protein n=1 Tax=Kalanchoe fedtschenkoi TaxID=63787 RepID=A0A7N1A7B5_KALFE
MARGLMRAARRALESESILARSSPQLAGFASLIARFMRSTRAHLSTRSRTYMLPSVSPATVYSATIGKEVWSPSIYVTLNRCSEQLHRRLHLLQTNQFTLGHFQSKNMLPLTHLNGELVGFGRPSSDSSLTTSIRDAMFLSCSCPGCSL